MSENEKDIPHESQEPSDFFYWRKHGRIEKFKDMPSDLQEKWNEVDNRIRASAAELTRGGLEQGMAQSMAMLNDEELGYILGIANKLKIDLTRKYELLEIEPRYGKAVGRYLEMRERDFTLVQAIVDKLLQGEKILPDDYNPEKYPNVDYSQFTKGGFSKKSAIKNKVWHELCQWINGSAMSGMLSSNLPNVFNIPKDKLEPVFRELFEDIIREGLK